LLIFIRMKKDVEKIIELGEGVKTEIKENSITLKKEGKELRKKFNANKILIEEKEGNLVISAKNTTRRELKMIGTLVAHIKNMIRGLNDDFEYKLEICYVHFPMNVKVQGDKIIIKSFLGETTQREAKIMSNTNVDIKGNQIVVNSPDIEAAGQTAANLEKATKVTGRDRRIFQDGIFITEKCGRAI